MPVTFPAHQGLVIGIKMRWPRKVDATALCIGAATPDLAYALGPWLNRQSHTALGVIVWALPVTLLAVRAVRWRAASGIFAQLPDLGPLRLRSYRVLGLSHHPATITLISAVVGAASHVLVDGFTHRYRWGAQWLGFDRVIRDVPLRGEFTVARVLQYMGHSLASMVFIAALVIIASTGRLEAWYGSRAVEHARSSRPTNGARWLFWLILAAPPPLAVALVPTVAPVGQASIFLPLTVLFFSTLVAGVVVGSTATNAVPNFTLEKADSPRQSHIYRVPDERSRCSNLLDAPADA